MIHLADRFWLDDVVISSNNTANDLKQMCLTGIAK